MFVLVHPGQPLARMHLRQSRNNWADCKNLLDHFRTVAYYSINGDMDSFNTVLVDSRDLFAKRPQPSQGAHQTQMLPATCLT